MATFTAGAFKDQLATSLRARGALAGVTVYDAETNTEGVAREHIVLGDWSSDDEYLTQGTSYNETYDVTGRIFTKEPESAKAARDRALALLTEVKDQLGDDHTVSAVVFDAYFSGYTAEEGIWSDQGRTCELSFTIHVEAHSP